jgi:hypothetical protein
MRRGQIAHDGLRNLISRQPGRVDVRPKPRITEGPLVLVKLGREPVAGVTSIG